MLNAHHGICMQDGWKILEDAYGKALLTWQAPAIYDV
jgi:hypothetical protein